MTADINVVVFDKYELVAELGVAHQLGNLLQHSLAGFVEGMSLPGKNELHRTIRIVHHRSQPLYVGEDQVGALIGGKPACESDGERIRAQDALQPLQGLVRLSAALRLVHCPPPYKFYELRLQIEVRLPEF